jgi:hypothetical protein
MISVEPNKIKPKSMERDENCSTLNMIIEISTFSQNMQVNNSIEIIFDKR